MPGISVTVGIQGETVWAYGHLLEHWKTGSKVETIRIRVHTLLFSLSLYIKFIDVANLMIRPEPSV
jgi:hypothetical protein